MNIIREIQHSWFPKTLKCVYRKDILEYALKHHKYSNGDNHGGLCKSIVDALYYYGIYIDPTLINVVIPLFTMSNSSRFNSRYSQEPFADYWWPIGDWDNGRLDFLKWLIERYKDDKTNLKEL